MTEISVETDKWAISVLICPNAFKGSLTSVAAAQIIATGLRRGAAAVQTLYGRELQLDCLELPLADGGDGTLETLVAATGGEVKHATVQDPLGRPIMAAWGRLGGYQSDTAVIEMAQAAGLRLLKREEYNPLTTTTYGVGQLMRAALEAGCRKLIVGIGGSATNDCGTGMAQALGARLLDASGNELQPGGAALKDLATLDTSDWSVPDGTAVVAACDVDNPLCGPHGAAATYGPQKGATPSMIEELDSALQHFADVWQQQRGVDLRNVSGAGAAGGLGAGLMAFCQGSLRPGTDLILDLVDFDLRCRRAHLVITGEGRLDAQTVRGKLIAGVTRRSRAAGRPVVALVGSFEEGAEQLLRGDGLAAAISIVDGPTTVSEAMERAEALLCRAAERLLPLITMWL